MEHARPCFLSCTLSHNDKSNTHHTPQLLGILPSSLRQRGQCSRQDSFREEAEENEYIRIEWYAVMTTRMVMTCYVIIHRANPRRFSQRFHQESKTYIKNLTPAVLPFGNRWRIAFNTCWNGWEGQQEAQMQRCWDRFSGSKGGSVLRSLGRISFCLPKSKELSSGWASLINTFSRCRIEFVAFVPDKLEVQRWRRTYDQCFWLVRKLKLRIPRVH